MAQSHSIVQKSSSFVSIQNVHSRGEDEFWMPLKLDDFWWIERLWANWCKKFMMNLNQSISKIWYRVFEKRTGTQNLRPSSIFSPATCSECRKFTVATARKYFRLGIIPRASTNVNVKSALPNFSLDHTIFPDLFVQVLPKLQIIWIFEIEVSHYSESPKCHLKKWHTHQTMRLGLYFQKSMGFTMIQCISKTVFLKIKMGPDSCNTP